MQLLLPIQRFTVQLSSLFQKFTMQFLLPITDIYSANFAPYFKVGTLLHSATFDPISEVSVEPLLPISRFIVQLCSLFTGRQCKVCCLFQRFAMQLLRPI